MLFSVAVFDSFSLLCGVPVLQLLTPHPDTHQLFADKSISFSSVDSKNTFVPPFHLLFTLHQDSTVICLLFKCVYHLCLLWLLYDACMVSDRCPIKAIKYIRGTTDKHIHIIFLNMLSVLRELTLCILFYTCFILHILKIYKISSLWIQSMPTIS